MSGPSKLRTLASRRGSLPEPPFPRRLPTGPGPVAGGVVFVGAGPGDPELLTLRGARALREADVVLVDHLVGRGIVEAHVRPGTRVVHVGKRGRSADSTPQSSIDALLVEHALRGQRVVRLKGGDIGIYGNLLDELEALERHRIPFELVPGVTAASGASAAAGIPLTARGHSRGVRFLALVQGQWPEAEEWRALADTDDTLVFYMSGNVWSRIVDALVVAGIAGDKGIALVRSATTPEQEVYVHRFSALRETPVDHGFMSPSLIVVGRVALLHERFGQGGRTHRWQRTRERVLGKEAWT